MGNDKVAGTECGAAAPVTHGRILLHEAETRNVIQPDVIASDDNKETTGAVVARCGGPEGHDVLSRHIQGGQISIGQGLI